MVIGRGYKDGKAITVALCYIGRDSSGKEAFLEEGAALAFARMAAAAKRDGVELIINSAFRDHNKQSWLWSEYQRDLALWDRQPMALRPVRPLRPSRPGYSRHEAGTAVDIDLRDDRGRERPAAAWLRTHAAEFGFAAPIAAEPWHYQYEPSSTGCAPLVVDSKQGPKV